MSVLVKEIRKKVALSESHIQEGFKLVYEVGELIAEVEQLIGSDNLNEWYEENFPEINMSILRKSLKLFKGERVKIEAKHVMKEVETA